MIAETPSFRKGASKWNAVVRFGPTSRVGDETEDRIRAIRAIAVSFLAAAFLAACATDADQMESQSGLADQERSGSCGSSVIMEWDGSPGQETPAAAVQEMIDTYTVALEKADPDAKPQTDLDDPDKLKVIIRGLTAALDEAEAQDTTAMKPGGEVGIGFLGLLDGVAVSDIRIDLQWEGGYRVTDFTAFAARSDGPNCDVPYPAESAPPRT